MRSKTLVCSLCGSSERSKNGRCKPCLRRRAGEFAARMKQAPRPCRKCGAKDRDGAGHCKPCKRASQQKTLVCSLCGSSERSKNGRCKPCLRRRAGEFAAFEAEITRYKRQAAREAGKIFR